MSEINNITVMSISVDHRTDSAPKVQEILTEHGDAILGRFGIHNPDQSNIGLITINLRAKSQKLQTMINDLENLEGVCVNHMDA